MAKIKSFEDACNSLKTETALPDFSMIPEVHRKPLEAHYKLIIIAQAINKSWHPDWKDDDQYKYYPWFEMDGDSGFSFHYVYGWSTFSFVGSRLCFGKREDAEYAGKTFIDLYKEYFLLTK